MKRFISLVLVTAMVVGVNSVGYGDRADRDAGDNRGGGFFR
jgi:hypothetical protein